MKAFLVLPIMITLFISPSTGRDSLTPTNPLLDNQTLVSAGGAFALGFFTPGNLGNRYVGMWFNVVPDRRIVWVANRASPVVNSTGLLSITANGTMMITDQRSKTIVWSVGNTISGLSNPAAQLLDTGNFVVKEDGNNNLSYAWQSFEHPSDTLLEGMKFRMDWTTGQTVDLTAWKSNDDPSDGEYYIGIDTGTVDYYLRSSSGGKVWRSDGNWDGLNLRSKGLNYNFVNNSREASFSFQASDKPMMFVASPTGTFQLLVLSSDSQRWGIAWEEPANQCSMVGHCGPNGICDIESSPVCSCLEGYVPKNLSRWASADWSDGCVREMGFDCRNGTDRFVAVGGAKLPEYPTASAAMASNLDECRLLCLRDCSCTAYAMDGAYYGCVNWLTNLLSDTVKIQGFDQDLYVRVPSSYFVAHVQPHRSKHKVVAISVSLFVGALILATASVVCVLRKRRTRRGVANICIVKSNEYSTADLDIPLFDFGTIEAATDYFSAANELGHGGFGTVYKGKLGNGQEIAVKRLAATSLQGADEFKNEVKLIAKFQNVNLVRLLGCCAQGAKERMLIYEYLSNKSLDAFLLDKQKAALLDWGTRYKIIIGIARGLLYLHHDSLFRIIHRDLKASNILLDNDMNPKISDFGMAKLFGGDETDFNTRTIVGTYGYMSPEYAMEGFFSLKSDVYSFGVLMLEIISGKKNRGEIPPSPYLNLVAEVWNLWTRGESLKLVDESMSKTFLEKEVLRCIKVGLLCVQEHPEDRPLMSTVIVMLGADLASLPEPKMPGFAARIGPFELVSFSNKQARIGLNELDKVSSNELTTPPESK